NRKLMLGLLRRLPSKLDVLTRGIWVLGRNDVGLGEYRRDRQQGRAQKQTDERYRSARLELPGIAHNFLRQSSLREVKTSNHAGEKSPCASGSLRHHCIRFPG